MYFYIHMGILKHLHNHECVVCEWPLISLARGAWVALDKIIRYGIEKDDGKNIFCWIFISNDQLAHNAYRNETYDNYQLTSYFGGRQPTLLSSYI